MTFNTMVIMRWNDALLGVYIARSSSAKPAREHVTIYVYGKIKSRKSAMFEFCLGSISLCDLYSYLTHTYSDLVSGSCMLRVGHIFLLHSNREV